MTSFRIDNDLREEETGDRLSQPSETYFAREIVSPQPNRG